MKQVWEVYEFGVEWWPSEGMYFATCAEFKEIVCMDTNPVLALEALIDVIEETIQEVH